jgi:cyclic pyranopterin phosphate synthase
MPECGVELKQHSEMLSYEEIAEVTRVAVSLGINKVRLTGGEPLVRRNIVDLVSLLTGIEGLEMLAMTTNGVMLPLYAMALREAGLKSVNISLDTLNPERYRRLTRGGDVQKAIAGVDAAVAAGFDPIKVNTVVSSDSPPEEIQTLEAFCNSRGIHLQRIGLYHLDQDKVDFQSFERPPKCAQCNRLRLTADGYLKPCLHSDSEVPVDFRNIEMSIRQAVGLKPKKGSVCTNRSMISIGG